jgi:4-hydroxybenzoate polyprenyltransferase
LFCFFIGAVAMRGAGCVVNDIIDRDIDAKTERTKGRPLASAGFRFLMPARFWLYCA